MRGGAFTHGRPAAWTTRRGFGTAVGGLLAVLVLTGLVLGGLGGGALGGSRAVAAPAVLGLDVSDHQTRVDWSLVRADGAPAGLEPRHVPAVRRGRAVPR